MAAPRRIVFLDRCTLPVPLRAPAFAHAWVDHDATAPAEAAARLEGATVAITNKVRVDGALLDACPSVRLVAIAATGTDVVDLAAARERGVAVANIRGYAGGAVGEHALMLMLALRRNLIAYREDLAKGRWQASPGFCLHGASILDLEGARLALVGYGTLARTVEDRARAFGMEVVVAERRGATPRDGRMAFDEVLATADVLSLHCPLTPETRHLLGAAEFSAMKPGAILINTARGALVDYPAMIAALRAGKLGGAGIDVLEAEPPVAGHPLLEAGDLPNLIVTPHVAWASRASMERLGAQLIDVIEAWDRGEPRNLVT